MNRSLHFACPAPCHVEALAKTGSLGIEGVEMTIFIVHSLSFIVSLSLFFCPYFALRAMKGKLFTL
jgi:hypothetical protein